MKKNTLRLPVILCFVAGLAIGITAHYLFTTDIEEAEASDDFIQKDYVKLLQENSDLLKRSIELHEENKLIRDEADKLAGLIEQYQMELNRFIEE